MSVLLAVDGGQTALRMAVVEDGQPTRVVEVEGFSHAAGDPELRIAAAVARAHEALALDAPVARICLGLTGAPPTRPLQARLGALISERLGGAEVALGADMVTAHAGALAGGTGVVVAAGTGAVVLAVDEDGTAHRVDGLGYLLGDDGSGFAIAHAAVRAAMRAKESRGPQTALLAAATSFFGGLDDLPHRVATSSTPVGDLAAFAPRVAAAARDGDAVAASIWAQAVEHLVTATTAALEHVFTDAAPDSVPVSHSGRLFTVDDLLLEPFKTRLAERCPSAIYRAPAGDSLAGAARLVQDGVGRYAALLHITAGVTA